MYGGMRITDNFNHPLPILLHPPSVFMGTPLLAILIAKCVHNAHDLDPTVLI